MNIAELRGQFTVFLFMGSADLNTEMKAVFNEAGYESFLFMDQETLVHRVPEASPHVILFTPEALMTSMSEFVSQVLQANSEVSFVCIAPAEQAKAISEYRVYNFAGFVSEGAEVALRCLWQVDQVCENLVRTYQGEELLSEKEKSSQELSTLLNQVQNLEMQNRTLAAQAQKGGVGTLVEKAKAYENLSNKEEYISAFLRRISCQAIYFKYLPSVSSFVAVTGHGIDIDKIKGIGSRMSAEELKDPMSWMMAGKIPESLNEVMTEGLKISKFHSRPVPLPRTLDGLFVFWGDDSFDFKEVENEFILFLLFFQRAHLQKQAESLQVIDPVTELHNAAYFRQRLDEEIARARRLKKAVSVVRMSIDHLAEVEQSYGTHHRDMVLRTVGTIIKKTSRTNDLSCRTEDNQISLILPHCTRRGAALRAERLRRIIEAHEFATMDSKITVSCGVSEYPSLSQNALDLEVSATKALDFIVDKGGNKVCLYKPVEEFKPDFEVAP